MPGMCGGGRSATRDLSSESVEGVPVVSRKVLLRLLSDGPRPGRDGNGTTMSSPHGSVGFDA